MKIKEITLQTGLTDKAIRLYIENGLVSPVIEEAYNGRKKIDFSQADADRLKNIAILRKAGFSINDIKEIISGGEAAEDTVKSFIEEAKKQKRTPPWWSAFFDRITCRSWWCPSAERRGHRPQRWRRRKPG